VAAAFGCVVASEHHRVAAKFAVRAVVQHQEEGLLGGCHRKLDAIAAVPGTHSAAQKDRLFRFADLIKHTLGQTGDALALVARSGTDLRRFGLRYSHAGFSLKDSDNGPWSVRQLYYACEEGRPRLFDQGLAGFVLGGSDPSLNFLSAVVLPQPDAAALHAVVTDRPRALSLLGAAYSANAYAWGTRFQNCNQWVAEMLALAWQSAVPPFPSMRPPDLRISPRQQAQEWLYSQGYVPAAISVANPVLALASTLFPWVHREDHPADDLAQHLFRVSMPASIDAFVRLRHPQAKRFEFCHTERHVVVRRGWAPLSADCQPAPGDEVLQFDDADPGGARSEPQVL
jgi:hypothetical protein